MPSSDEPAVRSGSDRYGAGPASTWPYPWPPRAATLLDRHLVRTGAAQTVNTDPHAAYQVNMLRHLLSVLEAALADEGVDPDVALRVIEKLIYGGAPNPNDAAERTRLMERLADLTATSLTRPQLIPIPAPTNESETPR